MSLTTGLLAHSGWVVRGESGEVPAELVDWWTTFQDADHEARDAMLRADDGPKKRRRTRSRGRKKQDDMGAEASPPEAAPDE